MKQWVYIKGALNTKLGDEGSFIARSSELKNIILKKLKKWMFFFGPILKTRVQELVLTEKHYMPVFTFTMEIKKNYW